MPNCFQLIRKSKIEEGPVLLSEIDEELCKELGYECHPTNWLFGWFNDIGFWIATGRTWEQIRIDYKNRIEEALKKEDKEYADFISVLIKILDYLELNFIYRAWWERK